jgi:ankyrin repeat protein
MIIIANCNVINAAQEVKENKAIGRLTYEQQNALENVLSNQNERQLDLARPPVYKMIDAAIVEGPLMPADDERAVWAKVAVNWQTVFKIIDSMQGVINVNEYKTRDYEYPLLWLAIRQKNIPVIKILLEKYKTDPNYMAVPLYYSVGRIPRNYEKYPDAPGALSGLMVACKMGDVEIVKLLLQHGGNPNLKNRLGEDSFTYAKDAATIKALNEARNSKK